MRTDRPSEEQAQQAIEQLSTAIAKFADSARAPWERGTPDPNPSWIARPSTLRFSHIRGGGWAWSMHGDDYGQTVAFYVVPANGDVFGMVTAHGQARHNFWATLQARHIYPTESPWREWFDFRQRYEMEKSERSHVR